MGFTAEDRRLMKY